MGPFVTHPYPTPLPGTWDTGQTLQPVLCPTSCLAACPALGALGRPNLSFLPGSRVMSWVYWGTGLRGGCKVPGLGYLVRVSSTENSLTFLLISLPTQTHQSAPKPTPFKPSDNPSTGRTRGSETLNITSPKDCFQITHRLTHPMEHP